MRISYLCLIAGLFGEFELLLKGLERRLVFAFLLVSTATQKQGLRCFRAIASRLIESKCLFVKPQAPIRFTALNVQTGQRQTRPRLILAASISLRGFEPLLKIFLGVGIIAASQMDITQLNRATRNQAFHLIGLS